MLFLLLSFLAAQTPAQAPSPPSLEKLKARLCPPLETHVLDADEKKIVVAIAEHYRKYEWTREKGFVELSVGNHAVASLKSPSVLIDRSMPIPDYFVHPIKVKLESHGVAPALAAELLAASRAANATYKTFDTSGLPLVTFRCEDHLSLLAQQAPEPGRDMTNAGTAISMSVPAFDATRTNALVVSLNDLESQLGHGFIMTEVSLLTKRGDTWVVAWHSLIGMDLGGGGTRETAVTSDDRAVFDAMLARITRTRIAPNQCIRLVNESRVHDATEISIGGEWKKRGGEAAEAFQDMHTRLTESIADYRPKVRAELVPDETRDFGPCGGMAVLALPGFSKDRRTAFTTYSVGFLTPQGTEWGIGTMLLRRTGKGWMIAEDKYELSMRDIATPARPR